MQSSGLQNFQMTSIEVTKKEKAVSQPLAPPCCARCGSLSAKSRCARCKGPLYCSSDCQKYHFAVHKLICKRIIAERSLPSPESPIDDLAKDLDSLNTTATDDKATLSKPPPSSSSSPQTKALDTLSTQVLYNAEMTLAVTPTNPTLISPNSPVFKSLSDSRSTAFFFVNEFRSLPANHGRRFLATSNVLEGFTVFVVGPQQPASPVCFMFHVNPRALYKAFDQASHGSVFEEMPGVVRYDNPGNIIKKEFLPKLEQALRKTFEGVDRKDIRIWIGGLDECCLFYSFLLKLISLFSSRVRYITAGGLAENDQIFPFPIPPLHPSEPPSNTLSSHIRAIVIRSLSVTQDPQSLNIDTTLLHKFKGTHLHSFQDEARMCEQNQRFEVLALDLELGKIVSSAKFDFAGAIATPKHMVEEERKLKRARSMIKTDKDPMAGWTVVEESRCK